MLIKIKKVKEFEDLPTPQYMTKGSAGMDLYAAINEKILLKPGERKLISSGISIEIPEGYEVQIRPRSGLAIKHGITLVNSPGTIDADYRGEIKIIMINFGEEVFEINKGDRIAQMVVCPIIIPQIEIVNTLNNTVRGNSGFGSTGI